MFFAYLILVAWCLCGEKKNEPPNSEESGARIQEGKYKTEFLPLLTTDYWLLTTYQLYTLMPLTAETGAFLWT